MRKLALFWVSMFLSLLMLLVMAAPAMAGPKALVKVIARGAAIHGANGMFFDAGDNLYIASSLGQEILVMNPRNGKIIKRMGTEKEIANPNDLTIGPDGSLYWTDTFQGNVYRMSPDGNVASQFVAGGVIPITLSDDGRLFVALNYMGDGLYELSPDLSGEPIGIIVPTDNNDTPLGYIGSFDFGPDGKLYGPLLLTNEVVSIDIDAIKNNPNSNPRDNEYIKVIADGFQTVCAAKFDSQGRLHVVDGWTGEVFRIDIETGAKTIVAKLSPGIDNLAFDTLGNLYVANNDGGSVTRIMPNGRVRIISPEGMIFPSGVAVLPGLHGRDSVFVADIWRLYEIDGLTGRKIDVSWGPLIGEGLTYPFTVSAKGNDMIITSWMSSLVQIWNPQTKEVINQYSFPVVPINSISLKDDLVVASVLSGVFWASDTQTILDPSIVPMPFGLASDGDKLWIADTNTGKIWEVEFEGKIPVSSRCVVEGLNSPEGLALDIDGSLLVVETGARRLSRVDILSGDVSIVAENLALMPLSPVINFGINGVAVSPTGAVYVTGNAGSVLYRIWPRDRKLHR